MQHREVTLACASACALAPVFTRLPDRNGGGSLATPLPNGDKAAQRPTPTQRERTGAGAVTIHRTAVFTLHRPTRRVRAILDHALVAYTRAYTTALHSFGDETPEELRAMATIGVDTAGELRMHYRQLARALYRRHVPAIDAALMPLEGGIRESFWFHVARTFLSYAALATRADSSSQAGSTTSSPSVPEATSAKTGAPSAATLPLGSISPPSTSGATRGAALTMPVPRSGSASAGSRQWRQAHVSPPARLRLEDGERLRLAGLRRLAQLADNREEELRCRNLLQHTAAPRLVPIPFCRIDPERHCALFYNPDTKRYYARLHVISFRSRRGRAITMAGRYVDLRSGQVYMRQEDARHWSGIRSFGRSRSSILVPLEMGRWHQSPQRFTETAFLPPSGVHAGSGGSNQSNGSDASGACAERAVPVCAWLVKRGETYRLHVVFRFPAPPRLSTRALLGIDRGMTCLAAGAVVSADTRQVIETVLIDGRTLSARLRKVEDITSHRQRRGCVVRGRQRSQEATAAVHAAANQLVELARAHHAQVVMEDLLHLAAPRRARASMLIDSHLLPTHQHRSTRRGGRSGRHIDVKRSNLNAMLPRRQYQKLIHAVNARLALVGLPKVQLVSPAYTSLTCSQCGHVSRENRSLDDRQRFHCAACGYETHADIQAGISIARKTLWLAQRKRESHANVPLAARTSWPTFIHTMLSDGGHSTCDGAADTSSSVVFSTQGGRCVASKLPGAALSSARTNPPTR